MGGQPIGGYNTNDVSVRRCEGGMWLAVLLNGWNPLVQWGPVGSKQGFGLDGGAKVARRADW